MPNSKSARKRLRQNITKRLINRSARSQVRSQIRRVRRAVTAEEVEQSETEFLLAARKLDQLASKNLIHPNSAARTKSRLSAAIKKIKGK